MVNLPKHDSVTGGPGNPTPSLHPEPEVDRQLARLFGESVFGAWLDPSQYLAAGAGTKKRGSTAKRLGILVAACALVGASIYLARTGFRRQESRAREHVAHDLATYLAEGELSRAGKMLDVLAPRTAPLEETDPHLELVLRAESALYRYHDGDEERRRRIAPLVERDAGNARRGLSRFVISSRAEGVIGKANMEGVVSRLPREPEGFAVLAQMLEAEGDVKAARAAWGRSRDHGQLWMPLRFQHAYFEYRAGRAKDAAGVVEGMIAGAPESAWTLSARALFAPALPLPPRDPKEDPHPPQTLPPVGVYYQHVVAAFMKVKSGDLPGARIESAKALEAVDGAPFVLDLFDTLVDLKAYDLAYEMTSLESWPRQHPLARARVESMEEARSARALPTPNSPAAADGEGAPPAAKEAKAAKGKKAAKKSTKKSGKRKASARAGKKAGKRG